MQWMRSRGIHEAAKGKGKSLIPALEGRATTGTYRHFWPSRNAIPAGRAKRSEGERIWAISQRS
jgi:hypothetical protein